MFSGLLVTCLHKQHNTLVGAIEPDRDRQEIMDNVHIIAGSISSLIFATGTLNMLVKAWRTKDVHSYSVMQLALNNVGNLVHWLYISSLPLGPIWFLHGFFTLSTALMLLWYWLYHSRPQHAGQLARTVKRITQTIELPAIASRQ